MRTLTDISPYRLGDPTLADANGREVGGMLGLKSRPAWLHILPCTPIPVFEPAAAYPEATRTVGLFHLPFAYLPEEVWMRRPAERYGAYAMRLIVAMDALGLLAAGDGEVWFAPIPGAPDDPGAAGEYAASMDGEGGGSGFDVTAEEIQGRADDLWTGGYPIEEQLVFSRQLAYLSMRGSAVLAAQRAIALADGDDPEARAHSVEILRAARGAYGDLFAPDMTPDGVRKWTIDNKGTAFDLLDQLAGVGLESQATADAAREVFGEL